ncbi:HEAT repeat domain-containing protein [Dactylosporangium sp. NPDC048998]|uniref:HEAT repeat domain-containing protein n=1 Tax=Dactylosporangium sp. NPDC048998 TaxID=3363976 RepID=UPI00371FA1F3
MDALVDVLADVDAVGDEDCARAALRVLGDRPTLVVRLDEHARRVLWNSSYHSPALNRLASRLDGTPAGPIAVALASTHTDGRVRERAIAAMLDRPSPELMPFLALRTGDWVAQVRDRARGGLAVLFADDPGTYLPAALPTVLLLEPRLRGGFAYTQAFAALITAPVTVREALAGAAERRQRRFVFDVARTQGWLGLDDLLAAAESDDVWIRVRAAEAACREAVWTRRLPVLERLARSRRADVRALALTGLVRVGEDTTVVGHLADDAPLVRAVARDAARRCGADVLGYYRTAVTEPAPPAGAIAGLAETGTAADAALLRPLLTHDSGTIRAQAVRALGQLNAADIDATIPLLRDPSPAVVREATAALRPFPRRVAAGLAWQLLAEARAELRRAGYRLLRDRPTALHLRAALILTVDPDAGLARRGLADVTRLAREAAQPSWRSVPRPELLVTAAEHAELTELAHQAAPALGNDTTGLLTAWLTDSGA